MLDTFREHQVCKGPHLTYTLDIGQHTILIRVTASMACPVSQLPHYCGATDSTASLYDIRPQVGNHLFNGVDGYGHGDIGRDTLEDIYASLFGAEVSHISLNN